jgi:uncharacterized membrane protein YfcA
VNALKLIPYWELGQFNADNLKVAFLLMPIAIAGTFIGVRLVRVLKPEVYFGFVQMMLFVVSVKLIFDAV